VPNLESLLNDLANLDAQHDLEGMRRVREAIVSEHPDSEAAVEALYKIGLDLLFRERKLGAAVEKFEDASKRKHPYWSAAARTSLGLCYYHQKRLQKALFELRKVAYPDKATVHSVTALAFVEQIFSNEGKPDEVKRVRKDRITQLEALVQESRERGMAQERGFHLYSLGLALIDHGEEARARAVLEEAKALGPSALGADLYRSVLEALER
jgi:tetratricopeptide (TPR) repeat protein